MTPPGPRPADAFDPGAKYHVPANVPYMRYFLADIHAVPVLSRRVPAGGLDRPAAPLHGLRQQGSRREVQRDAGDGRRPSPGRMRWRRSPAQREIDASADERLFRAAAGLAEGAEPRTGSAAGEPTPGGGGGTASLYAAPSFRRRARHEEDLQRSSMSKIFSAAIAALFAFAAPASPRPQTAVFAGGCFWCMEHDMERDPRRDFSDVRLHRRHDQEPDLRGRDHRDDRPLRGRRVTFDPHEDHLSPAARRATGG